MFESTRSLTSAIVVISDRLEVDAPDASDTDLPRSIDDNPDVYGGYLERLPLAAVRHGLADFAEIWHHRTNPGQSVSHDGAVTRRSFQADTPHGPFGSAAISDFISQHGAPRILCVWGLGVSEDVLAACSDSFIIYNSIDAPALRVPPEISRHFDLVLTGAQWQSEEVRARHPDMPTAILPIGPEFASPETFYPIGCEKTYDIIYVAAAQPYKRHDVLFSALARSPRQLKALCVMGYGEDAESLRREAQGQGLTIDFVGPPGVSYPEVNRLMNQARVGVVCGQDDGAPAILTEYMLAGLPVVANAALACGLQYILPQTGIVAPADAFEHALLEALDNPSRFHPRQAVLDQWAWPHSIARLDRLIHAARSAAHPIFHSSGHPEGGSFEPSNPA